MQEKFDPISNEELEAREARLAGLPKGQLAQEVNDAHAEANLLYGRNFYQQAELETDPEFKEDLFLALKVAELAKAEGGLALVVGGFTRDEALKRFGQNVASKDTDIEVYGVPFVRLQEILKSLGEINIVGASFGVVKLGGLDISIPRRDSKTGLGHKGFTVEGDPNMTVEEAARRRDFTMNSLALDPLTGEIIDKFGGMADIQKKVLRATDPKTFVEDPLRVLRAMQFAGRFGFTVESETLELCRSLDLSELAKERVGEEWNKLLLKSPKPSVGLNAGREMGVISKLHPELNALIDVPQEKEWHPEGDVWIHTGMVVDAAAEISRRENLKGQDMQVVMLASLCHDLGKPATTEVRKSDGRIISHSHSEAGLEPTQKFLESLKVPHDIIKKILPLVAEHLWPSLNKNPSDTAVRRLAHRLHPATIKELVMVGEADHRGRDLPWHGYPEGEVLLQHADRLEVGVEKPKPLVQGRDLLLLGLKPGSAFKPILNMLFEAQLEGKFHTTKEGVEYYKSLKE